MSAVLPLRVRVGIVLTGAWLVAAAAPYPPADVGRMPVCQIEDGSAGVLPCRRDGGPNGEGLHYIIREDGSVKYLGTVRAGGTDWVVHYIEHQ